jgi:hypothetical protein
MGRLPSKSGGAVYRRLHRRLLRPVFSNVVINNVTAMTISASERYMRCTAVCMFIIFCEYMFRCYLFPFILLFSTSSMFQLHVIVAGIVMLNILELIMEIVPNYPTVLVAGTEYHRWWNCLRAWKLHDVVGRHVPDTLCILYKHYITQFFTSFGGCNNVCDAIAPSHHVYSLRLEI